MILPLPNIHLTRYSTDELVALREMRFAFLSYAGLPAQESRIVPTPERGNDQNLQVSAALKSLIALAALPLPAQF